MRLPSHWSIKKFEDISEIITGSTPSTASPEYYGGNIPFVTPGDLDSGVPITCTPSTLTDLGAAQARILPKGTVLVCCIGATIGKTDIAGTQLASNQQINSLVCNPEIAHPEYVYQYARTLKAKLIHMSSSTTLPIVNKSRFKQIEIPLPPLDEQKRIAAILDQADALRVKRRAALARLDDLVQSVFLEMFGDPVTNPMGWEVVKLAQTFSTKPQIGTAVPAHEGGEQIIIRVGELGDDYVALEKCKFVTLASKELKKFSVKAGDFLLARAIGSEDHLGKASLMQDTMMPVVYDSHVMRLRFDNKILLPQFFLIWMRTQGGRRRFMQRAGRTAVQFNINTKQISDIDLPLPPVSKQSQFVKFYDCIQIQQGRYTKALQIADKLFHSLQQRAFRGEL